MSRRDHSCESDDDLANDILSGAPESWDGDEAVCWIAAQYVRELERRVAALGGSLERHSEEGSESLPASATFSLYDAKVLSGRSSAIAKLYRSKPVVTVIEAMQWTGNNIDDLWNWAGVNRVYGPTEVNPLRLFVAANNVWLDLEVGEWIIKDDLGFYPCKDKMFTAKYELACWWTNGDHPDDAVGHPVVDPLTGDSYERIEGAVVRFYRHPDHHGMWRHPACGKQYDNHGWLDTGGEGYAVCPGMLISEIDELRAGEAPTLARAAERRRSTVVDR
jgi:hypothetical protein